MMGIELNKQGRGKTWASLLLIGASLLPLAGQAEPVTYTIDPAHTYPSFEVDHRGGLSVWRGKFNRSSGIVIMDKEAMTGSVDIQIDMTSIDFGFDDMNEHAMADDEGMLNVARFPAATYSGQLTHWEDGLPTAVDGELTLHGVSLPVDLQINQLRCSPARGGGEVCGADAVGSFDRADFGVNYAAGFGFLMYVNLRIQIEAQSEGV
jgi:polyisoprenoid-binding protein YceI